MMTGNFETMPYGGLIKARENTIEEKRAMRRDRNKHKKIKRRGKREGIKKKREKELKAAETAILEAQLEARRYKAIAKKYINSSKTKAQGKTAGLDVHVRSISRAHLSKVKKTDQSTLGKGVFGKCKIMMYQGQMVAAKEFRKSVLKDDVRQEASILSKFSHPGVPFVLGIDLSEKPYTMVTLFYGIDSDNTTLRELLNSDKFAAESEIKLDKTQALPIVIKLGETLGYIHNQGILHNDIKSDNIVFYLEYAELKPVLIDFGKACPTVERKYHKLSKEMQQKYRKKHLHIAPKIVEGTAPQSRSSDVYSFGLIIKKIGEFVGWNEIIKLGDICAEPNIPKRCTLNCFIEECKLLSQKQ